MLSRRVDIRARAESIRACPRLTEPYCNLRPDRPEHEGWDRCCPSLAGNTNARDVLAAAARSRLRYAVIGVVTTYTSGDRKQSQNQRDYRLHFFT